jgi:DNA polymerase-3 subunit delta
VPPTARRSSGPAATAGRTGPGRVPAGRTSTRPPLAWDEVELAPIVLVTGGERLLAERAVAGAVTLAKERDPDVEVTRLEGAAYTAGTLGVVTSPSLFGEARVVVIEGLEQATEELLNDALAYVDAPADDVVLVLQHGGGQRGKKLLDAVKATRAPVVLCEPIKKDADKVAFVTAELRRAGRRADASGVRALVEAVGADLRELAAACSQLVADTTGIVGAEAVARYYGGRIEATGFRVADAAIAGDTGQAVALLRHALATGADPVPLVAALAAKLRVLAKVAATRGRGSGPTRDLGLAPWQMDRARKDLAHWTPEALAAAITAVAQADAEVKGAGRDPVFAIERAVLRVASAASG